jgi:hypothetical protein
MNPQLSNEVHPKALAAYKVALYVCIEGIIATYVV